MRNRLTRLLSLFTLLFILIASGCDIKNSRVSEEPTSSQEDLNKGTKLTYAEFKEKLENEDTFVVAFVSSTCGHCTAYRKTINRYVDEGHTFYYVDLYEEATDDIITEIMLMFTDLPRDRNITRVYTPTTIYLKDGIFADGFQGAYGMDGGANYTVVCDIIEGRYVGEPVYHFE